MHRTTWSTLRVLAQEDGYCRAEDGASLTARTENAWRAVRLNVDYISHGTPLYIGIDPWYIGIEEAEGRLTLSRYLGGNLFAAWDIETELTGTVKLGVCAGPDAVEIDINGRTYRYDSEIAIPLTSVRFYPPAGLCFRMPQLAVEARDVPAVSHAAASEAKALDFTVDFYDDMQMAAFDTAMLGEMFATIARLGGSRAYWIHHGGRDEGLWQEGPGSANIMRSFDQLGDDYLPAAVHAAHRAGLPLIGIMKPFDTAPMHRSAPEAPGRLGTAALGGRIEKPARFPAAHPELCRQAVAVPDASAPVTRIELRSRRSMPPWAGQGIRLYVSEDNVSYRPYEGSLRIECRGDTLILSGLHLDHAFFALSFPEAVSAALENTLPLLASLYDAGLQPVPFTYGIAPRVRWRGGYHLGGFLEELDFQCHGLNFDCAGSGVPSAVWNASKTLLELYSPARSANVLGFARGVNRQAPGVLSEAEPEVHAYWLRKIQEMLDAGVDGMDIRIMNHGNIIDWSRYGFNRPLLQRYHERYGAVPAGEAYSPEKLRALRGEFFTEFLRAAAALVRSRGREFHLHIEDTAQGEASEPCPMDIAMPWRQWIEEGLCDRVTLKALNMHSNDTWFGREVMALCRSRGIRVSFSSFIHSVFGEPNRDAILASYLSSPCDAINIYEFATLFQFSGDGAIGVVDQAIVDWLGTYSWRTNRRTCRSIRGAVETLEKRLSS